MLPAASPPFSRTASVGLAHLQRAGMLQQPRRSVYQLTDGGRRRAGAGATQRPTPGAFARLPAVGRWDALATPSSVRTRVPLSSRTHPRDAMNAYLNCVARLSPTCSLPRACSPGLASSPGFVACSWRWGCGVTQMTPGNRTIGDEGRRHHQRRPTRAASTSGETDDHDQAPRHQHFAGASLAKRARRAFITTSGFSARPRLRQQHRPKSC